MIKKNKHLKQILVPENYNQVLAFPTTTEMPLLWQ
jgi:hypothetical protein